MEYMHLRGQVDISFVRSKSESAAFRPPARHNANRPRNVSPPDFRNGFTQVTIMPINDSRCCSGAPSLTRIKSCFQFFKMHLYNNHKVAIAVGVIAILIGVAGLIFSLGMSSIVSWCLITGGGTLIGGTMYHSGSVAMNCGMCRTGHGIDALSEPGNSEPHTPEDG